MKKELVALKVKIGLKNNGHALYPDFNMLDVVQTAKMDWCVYINRFGDGAGWHYDKVSGHRDNTVDSPVGQQWGVIIVPEVFAYQALVHFPDQCIMIDETELEIFYNNKAHVRDSDEIFTIKELEGIKIKQDLNIPLTETQLKALDPNDDTPGIVKNKRKIWSDYKSLANIKILTVEECKNISNL